MTNIEKTNFLSNLKNFIEEQNIWLQNTLNSVGWDVSDLKELAKSTDPQLIPCSVVPEHRIPTTSILKHEDICEKRNGRYPEATDSLDIEFGGYAVIMNYFCTDSTAINEEESQNAKKRNQQKESSAKYLMELLAAERDAKRRRAAHRGKRVHSNKKSYKEILKEVISSQMETLVEGDSTNMESENSKAESAMKDIIQPRADCYLGVGCKCFSGNPHKRWLFIEEEEKELINEMKREKHRDKDDYRREDSYERHGTYKKSNYDHRSSKKDHHHKRDRERDYEKSRYNREFSDSRSTSSHKVKKRSRSSSHYEERYSERSTDEYSYRKRQRDSDSHKSPSKRKKKHKERSPEKSSRKKSHHKSRHSDSTGKY